MSRNCKKILEVIKTNNISISSIFLSTVKIFSAENNFADYRFINDLPNYETSLV